MNLNGTGPKNPTRVTKSCRPRRREKSLPQMKPENCHVLINAWYGAVISTHRTNAVSVIISRRRTGCFQLEHRRKKTERHARQTSDEHCPGDSKIKPVDECKSSSTVTIIFLLINESRMKHPVWKNCAVKGLNSPVNHFGGIFMLSPDALPVRYHRTGTEPFRSDVFPSRAGPFARPASHFSST